MIRLLVEIPGTQTKTHCSMTSSLGACNKLSRTYERCSMFRKKLEYDFKAHAYKRCEECIKSEDRFSPEQQNAIDELRQGMETLKKYIEYRFTGKA